MSTFERRHDLDALRAGAMLLGIYYHSSLAFTQGSAWVVVDSERHLIPTIVVDALHGFRMPLFFLLSGFFVAMLWRKRGLRYLMRHRIKRIVIPMLLGVLTIIPMIHFAIEARPPSLLYSRDAGLDQDPGTAIWRAARWGDVDAVRDYLDEGGDPYATEPEFGATLMSMAGYAAQLDVVALLIERGVDVNHRDARGNTPLHAAARFGNDEIVGLLLENGADAEIENRGGRTPEELARTSLTVTDAIGAWMNIAVDEERTRIGKAVTIASLQGREVEPEAETTPVGAAVNFLMTTPVLVHLWFLWYLWLYSLAFAAISLVATRLQVRMPRPRFVLSSARFLWLLPLTLVPMWFMIDFGADVAFGLFPTVQLFAYYGIFFGFGVLYFEARDTAARLGRHWKLMLPIALFIILPPALDFGRGLFGVVDGLVDQRYHRFLGKVLEAVFIWLMVFGCMGLVRSVLGTSRSWVRYLSDSSYWLYLMHLPLVIFAQGVVANWELPLLLKLFLILAAVVAVLLLSYEYAVRYTWVGTMLNGPRTRPSRRTT